MKKNINIMTILENSALILVQLVNIGTQILLKIKVTQLKKKLQKIILGSLNRFFIVRY